MEIIHNHVKLTSAEISYLWSTYLTDSMSICIFSYFLKHTEDDNITALISRALDSSQQHVITIEDIFTKEKIQIPQGFTDKDVNLGAKRLFSDTFYLHYLKNMTKGGLATHGRVLSNVYRQDIRKFFSGCLTASIELDHLATRILTEKGIAEKPPVIPYPQKIELAGKQSFILDGFGGRSELTGTEATGLFANIQSNHLGIAIASAFSQVAHSEKVRKYFLRGNEIANKHIKVFSDYLEGASLPVPKSQLQEITDSKEPPFSDKLMLFHFSLMIYAGVGNYGISIAESQKSDLVIDYSRFNAEILKYSEDGANLMIANKWMEQPPLTADRSKLEKGERQTSEED